MCASSPDSGRNLKDIRGPGYNPNAPSLPSLLARKSSYSKNYGYEVASETSTISPEERQWYQDNGYGDPMATVEVAQPGTGRQMFGVGGALAGRARTKDDYKTFYRGISTDGRDKYQRSLALKPAPAPAPATTVLSTPPASTRYAGKALTINPMSS